MRGLEAVIFDFDGVMVDSFRAIYGMFLGYFKVLKRPFMSEEEFKEKFSADWKSFLRDLGKEHNTVVSISEEDKDKYVELLRDAPLASGIKESILKLKSRSLKLAVVSTSVREVITEKLAANGLHFDLIVSGYDLGISDKHTLLDHAIRQMNVNPKKCVYIGDMAEDIAAGKRVGVKTIALTTGFHSPQRLKALNPDALLDHAASLYETIERL